MIRDSFSGKDDRATCRYCDTHPYTKLADRTGAEFIVMREFLHRNVIFNSVPTYMGDREDELSRADVRHRHFLFTVERAATVDRIIDACRRGLSAEQICVDGVRRIK